ncbi:hypothetical protein ACWC0C_39125 [Streptomyces sp. NPDC001709]
MADEVSAQDAPTGRLTVGQALQFDDSLYRRFTALHEAGHAIVALATDEASVSECVIAPTETPDAGMAEAYTDVTWHSSTAYLTLLYGGVLAQQRWLHDQQLWSPLRESAVQALANHDYAALMATGASSEQLRHARSTALAFRDRHWQAIIAASDLLDRNGKITGDELDALLRQEPATPQAGELLKRAHKIAGESRDRAAQLAGQPAQSARHVQPLPRSQHAHNLQQQPGVHPSAGTDGRRAR